MAENSSYCLRRRRKIIKGKISLKKQPKLSKSQKRKLKKLEEEKEKEILLSKSIETLEKYKIKDDVYSLMWSSRNLGQVETVREKRRREVEFSKAGLELPRAEKAHTKRKRDDASQDIDIEVYEDEICLPSTDVHSDTNMQSSHDEPNTSDRRVGGSFEEVAIDDTQPSLPGSEEKSTQSSKLKKQLSLRMQWMQIQITILMAKITIATVLLQEILLLQLWYMSQDLRMLKS